MTPSRTTDPPDAAYIDAPPPTLASAEVEAGTTPVEHLILQLYGLGSVRRELSKAAHHELASQGFSALVAIRRRGACRVSDIATDLQVDLSVASRQIAALVGAGHVDRRPDPADGRASLLHLTEAGLAAIRAAHLRMIGVLSDALSDWSDDEVETLATSLQRLTQTFTSLAGTAPTAGAAATDHTQPSADQEIAR